MPRYRLALTAVAALLSMSASGCAPNLTPRLQLVASWPANGASLPVGRHTFDLTFNSPLDAPASTASVSRDGSAAQSEVRVDATDQRHLTVRLVDPRVGRYQLRWHAVAADAHDISDGSENFALQDESMMPPRLVVGQTTASDVGQPLDLTGNGFAKNSRVTLTIGDDDQPLATVDTDARGSFKTQPKVLDSIPFGVQPLTAKDEQGHKASAAIEVRWGGWPPAVPIDSGTPGPDPGQVTFTVQVRNRSDYVLEHITLVVRDPDGAQLLGTDPEAQRQDAGVVWELPTVARGLTGVFKATYAASGPLVSQAWMEFRHRPERGCTQNCPPAFISNSGAESTPVAPL